MDVVLRYLENAVRLRNFAAVEKDPKLKADLEKQSDSYRNLAELRARERNLPSTRLSATGSEATYHLSV